MTRTNRLALSALAALFKKREQVSEQIAATTPAAFPKGTEVQYAHGLHSTRTATVIDHSGNGEQLWVEGRSSNCYWIYVYRVLDSLK